MLRRRQQNRWHNKQDVILSKSLTKFPTDLQGIIFADNLISLGFKGYQNEDFTATNSF